ncbi:hypothetical protein EDD15DRAFT_2204114 [Pisolithus albus]|nr:hypothetical protein EDD15DRAFT_2204114 [Pisolithus albus]
MVFQAVARSPGDANVIVRDKHSREKCTAARILALFTDTTATTSPMPSFAVIERHVELNQKDQELDPYRRFGFPVAGALYYDKFHPSEVVSSNKLVTQFAKTVFVHEPLNSEVAHVLPIFKTIHLAVERHLDGNTSHQSVDEDGAEFESDPSVRGVLHQKGKLWISLQSNRTGAFFRILVPEVNDGATLERTLRKLADVPSVHSTERLEIGFSKDAHRKVIGEVWAYLFERLNKVSSLDLGTYPVPRILQILYCNAKGALEAQKQGKEVSVLLPSLETIAIATSLTLCVLVDMIAELRETAARERITVWLEGSFTGAQAEGEGESVGESEDSED